MTIQQILELVGYASSVLILISLLMTSVVKFRIINGIGSFIFAVYALCIHSYPTAVLNFCLVVIDVWFLIKVLRNKIKFSANSCTLEESGVDHFLSFYDEDISAMFPGYARSKVKGDSCFLVYANAEPVSVLVGNRSGSILTVALEYSCPSYRDTSVGKYLYNHLPDFGISDVRVPIGIERHNKYLESIGFKLDNNFYIRNLKV